MNIRRLLLVSAICLASMPLVYANDASKEDAIDRGVALVASKKYPEAIKLFDEVIKSDHKTDSVYFALSNRGDAYCMMHDGFIR